MVQRPIAFSSDQYDQLIAQLRVLITGIQRVETTGTSRLGDAVGLQPEGQVWEPAMTLVSMGKSFFGDTHTIIETILLPELTELHRGLVVAKAIFQSTEDLALVAAADFIGELQP
jgi:hypothetical protein